MAVPSLPVLTLPAFHAAASATVSTAPPPLDLMKLQNGSDIRGIAVEGVVGEAVNLTEAAVEAIATGFATFLQRKLPPRDRPLRVSVGHDSRISAGPLMVPAAPHPHPQPPAPSPTESPSFLWLQAAVARGLGCAGVEVVTFGLASTPAMFMSTVTEDARLLCPADGAIMITASHLPFNRNGLKFFTAQGGASKGDITAILTAAAQLYPTLHTAPSSAPPPASVDYMEVRGDERGCRKVEWCTIPPPPPSPRSATVQIWGPPYARGPGGRVRPGLPLPAIRPGGGG